MRKRILVIANPTAGRGRMHKLERLVNSLKMFGCTVIMHETAARGDAEHFIANTNCSHFDVVAVAGGDGTVNEVLNGLPPAAPPLAVLPLGTANVLAAEIGLPRSLDEIALTVAVGPSRPINLGEVNGRRFAVMASVGLDAAVVEKVNLSLKRHVGKWAYLYETFRQSFAASPSVYRLRINNEDREARGVIVANGRHYAGRFIVAPSAHLEKPSLDICQLTCPGRAAAPSYLISMLRDRLTERDDFQIDEATSLEIMDPIGAPLQADGDFLCRLPAHIRVIPAAAELIFPATRLAV